MKIFKGRKLWGKEISPFINETGITVLIFFVLVFLIFVVIGGL